ncbi:MAG: ferritin-like domain-containing protein, partial [Pseudonocardiaceae bacterium]
TGHLTGGSGKNTMKILELMQLPPDDHDLAWLQQALQAAVELEMATIPPYLCAMWSVKDLDSPVFSLIRNIVLEEMSHLGLACNMLTSIGGTPAINTPAAVPQYPGGLPGGVHPGLTIQLAGLSCEALETFMQVELPESGPIAFHHGMTFPTIGAFYDAVLAAFGNLPAGTITGQRQLSLSDSPVDLFAIESLADAEKAITTIKQQGEGTSTSPVGDPGDPAGTDNLAHYYKFAEIYHGHKLIPVGARFKFEGDAIPFPDVFPMAPVPPEGYPVESKDFDTTYTSVLDKLQAAWKTPAGKLGPAVVAMLTLGDLAVQLMQQPRPDGTGNFGPDFKLVSGS